MPELLKGVASASHLDLLHSINTYQLRDTYPNIEIALRIFFNNVHERGILWTKF